MLPSHEPIWTVEFVPYGGAETALEFGPCVECSGPLSDVQGRTLSELSDLGMHKVFFVFAASQLMSCHFFQSNHVGLIGSKFPWFHLLVWSCVAHCELFLLVLLLLLVWIVLSKTKGARLTLRNEKDQETLMQHEQSRLVKIHTTKPINLRFCPLGYVFSYRGNTV